jgi:hypothetical protein
MLMIAAALPEIAIVPHVLADADAELMSAQLQDLHAAVGLEVAVFVEDVVGGQERLVERVADASALHHHGAVEQRPPDFARVRSGETDQQRRRVFELARDKRELVSGAAHEALVHEQIARQVTHERKLGRGHQVGVGGLCRAGGADDERGVSVQIAGRWIHL